MSKTEKIIERKTPIPGEVEQYVWLDGALIRVEDLSERTMEPFPPKRVDWLELRLWGQLESPVPSME